VDKEKLIKFRKPSGYRHSDSYLERIHLNPPWRRSALSERSFYYTASSNKATGEFGG